MRSFALPGAARSGERVGERKNVPRDQEGHHPRRRPDANKRHRPDGDFRYEVRARKRDAWSSLGRLISRAGVYDFEANRPSGARTELDQANVLTFTLTSMPSSSSPLPQ
jgi:hypothetical protein